MSAEASLAAANIAIGQIPGEEEYCSPPLKDTIHTLVVGKPGTGKSTWIKSQLLQHVERGDSVFLIDPHGDLALEVLSWIPKSRWGDVVFIDPSAIPLYGMSVKYNPLQAATPLEEEQRREKFMESLRRFYEEFWGPRMEQLLRRAISVLYAATQDPTVKELFDFLTKPDEKAAVLSAAHGETDLTDFWRQTVTKYPEGSEAAAITKLDKLTAERLVTMMFDSPTSTFSFRDVMDHGKICVIRLPEGFLGSDSINFLGTLFMWELHLTAMGREDVPEDMRKPTYIFIDEAHRFVSKTLKEQMQALRKYHVYLRVASQNLEQYGREMREDIHEFTSTLAIFQVGPETAEKLAPYFEPTRNLVETPFFHFALCSPFSGISRRQTLKVINFGRGPFKFADVIRASLRKYGVPVDTEPLFKRRHLKEGGVSLPVPLLTPIEIFTLYNIIRSVQKPGDSVAWTALKRDVGEMYRGFSQRSVDTAVRKLTLLGYTQSFKLQQDARGAETTKSYEHYTVTPHGVDALYPPIEGGRGGGPAHTTMLASMVNFFFESGYYPIPSSGKLDERAIRIAVKGPKDKVEKSVAMWPDLIVYPPVKSYDDQGAKFSEREWDSGRAFAVEVETMPVFHSERAVEHYWSNADVGIPTMFVVSNQKDAEKLQQALLRTGASIVGSILSARSPQEVEIRVWDAKTSMPVSHPITQQWFKDVVRASGAEEAAKASLDKPKESPPGPAKELPKELPQELPKPLPAPAPVAEAKPEAARPAAAAATPPPVPAEKPAAPIAKAEPPAPAKETAEVRPTAPPSAPEAPAPPATAKAAPKPDIGKPTTGKAAVESPVKAKKPARKYDHLHAGTQRKRIRECVQQGWTFRVKKAGEKEYLYALKKIDGKLSEKYLGPHKDTAKRALKEFQKPT